jgi:hypothetical protein
MQAIGRMTVVLTTILAIGAETSGADCPPLTERIDSYERELKTAMRDEPEDLPNELRRYARALESDDAAQADRIQQKIRAGFSGLLEIDSPPDVARLHADMIDYYRAGVAVLDARDRGDDQARHRAEIQTWLGLKQYFTNIRELLVEHDCNAGDIAAIDEHYLPELEEHLEQMRTGRSRGRAPR